MTDEERPVDEADLHGWVDGRLDPARRLRVEQQLARDPALKQRVDDWAMQAAELRRAIRHDDQAGRSALLGRLALRSSSRRPGLGRSVAVAATIVLALGLGGVGGWVAHGDRRPTEISRLGMEAATTYRILSADPARAIEVSAANREELRVFLAEKLGRRIPLPDLSPMGFRLTSGRVLGAIYGPAALLVYSDPDGNRITIYLQPMAVGAPAPMRPLQTDALNGYAWIDGKIGYTVMSEDGKARLHAVADRVLQDSKL